MPNKVVQITAEDPLIIAPCGLNCSLCRAYTRDHKPCPGCRGGQSNKSNSCLVCAIKNCEMLAADGDQFCFSCDEFPCADLLHLEGRYTTKYGVSVIANLERIDTVGVERFIAEEAAKWSCPECGSLLCVHKPQCVKCGHTWQSTLPGPLKRVQRDAQL